MEIEHKKGTIYYLSTPMINKAVPSDFITGETVTDDAYFKDGTGLWTTLPITDSTAEIGSTGVYILTLSASEMDHDQVLIKLTSTGSADNAFLFRMFDNSIDDVDAAVGVVDGKIDTVDAAIVVVDNEIATIDGKVNTIDTEIGIIDGEIGVIDGKVNTIDLEVGIIDGKVDAVDAAIVVVDTEVGVIDGKVNTIDTEVGVIDSKVDTIDLEVGVIDGKVDTIDTEIGIIDSEVGVIDGKIDTIDNFLDTEIAAILAIVSNLPDSGNLTTLITHLTDIKGASFVGITDSLQAIRDQGTTDWNTATGFSTHSATDVRAEIDSNSTELAQIISDVGGVDTVVNSIAVIVASIEAVTDLIPNGGALNDLSTTDVKAQVTAVMNADIFAEISAIPVASTTLTNMIRLIYTMTRNKKLQTSSLFSLRNDADTSDIGSGSVSDDATTATTNKLT